MASTRYSMRLRPRGGGGNADGDNDASSTTAAAAGEAAASRTALGNISNREGNGDEKKAKPSGIVERMRQRGRSRASRAANDGEQPQADDAAPRRRSSRGASARAAEAITKTENAVAKKEAAAAAKKEKEARKAAAKKAAAAVKKEAKATKKGGTKRSSGEGGRASNKRAKKSDTTTSRSRSRSKSRGKKSSQPAERREMEPVAIVPATETRIVPHDFGLERSSFDGANFTYGIAHYDEPERSDPLACKDYVTDMFQHLYQAETQYHTTCYMDRQDDINEKMRAILIDWLVEVHMKFRLVPSSLYLCVQIIDRYCSEADVPRSKLQLVGVTALLLACKHEEIYPPEVRDCVYITDRAFDRQEVLDMEQTILRVLNWKISLPTAYPFLDRFLGLTAASPMTRQAATYYLERTLQEHELLRYRPSMVCASAVVLALNNPDIRILEEDYERKLPGLPKILMEYTGFSEEDMLECIEDVAYKINEPSVCASKRQLTAVKKKYEARKYHSVSTALESPSVISVKDNMYPSSDDDEEEEGSIDSLSP